jgi:hypothetical protein
LLSPTSDAASVKIGMPRPSAAFLPDLRTLRFPPPCGTMRRAAEGWPWLQVRPGAPWHPGSWKGRVPLQGRPSMPILEFILCKLFARARSVGRPPVAHSTLHNPATSPSGKSSPDLRSHERAGIGMGQPNPTCQGHSDILHRLRADHSLRIVANRAMTGFCAARIGGVAMPKGSFREGRPGLALRKQWEEKGS